MAIHQTIIRANGPLDESQVDDVINAFNDQVNAFMAPKPENKIREVRTEILLPFVSQKLALICFIIWED